jgi:hypothetical protein
MKKKMKNEEAIQTKWQIKVSASSTITLWEKIDSRNTRSKGKAWKNHDSERKEKELTEERPPVQEPCHPHLSESHKSEYAIHKVRPRPSIMNNDSTHIGHESISSHLSSD